MEFEDEEYQQFLQDLQQYPNYFQMGTEKCTANFWRKIMQKIENEKDELQKSSDLDRIKNQNLEACAAYYLGDVDKAERIISKVLEDCPSINACAMMAIMSYKKGEITKAKRHLCRIQELAANPYNIDVAKSELAYAYTRLDAMFYKKAIAAYTEAVERNPDNFPWKFGLAVIYRRCMNTSVQAMYPDLKLETCFNEAEKHLTYVIENCTAEEDRFFKARSYIEKADLYSTANVTNKLDKTDKQQIIDLVHQGVECRPKNTAVLMKAGRLLRHCFQFKEAERLLQRAYNICPNSYNCHQLGLIQKSNIIHQHKQSQGFNRYKSNREFQSRRGPPYRTYSSMQQNSGSPQVFKQLDRKFEYLASENGSKSFKQFDKSISSKSGKEPEHSKPINASTKAITDPKSMVKPEEDSKTTLVHDNDLEEDLAIEEPINQRSFQFASPYQTILKQLDPQQQESTFLDRSYSQIGLPDPFYPKYGNKFDKGVKNVGRNEDQQQLSLEKAPSIDPRKTKDAGVHDILSTKSKSEKELAETLSKVSLTNTIETGKEPIKDVVNQTMVGGVTSNTLNESKTETLPKVSLTNTTETGKEPVEDLQSSPSQLPSVSKTSENVSSGEPMKESSIASPLTASSWQTPKTEYQQLQIPVFKMSRLINSPGKDQTYDLELSRKLEPCLKLFKQSAELGQERNLSVYYDWGITLLQMTPTKFDEVIAKFNHILANDRSQFLRYRCYEQYGICKIRMGESPDFDEISKEDHRKDAVEMFRRAIRCWAYCQKINLSKHFDDAEGNCNSFRSIREIILGEESDPGIKPKKDMASLYYLVKRYGSSLSLYQEVHDQLQRTSDTDNDSEVIKGIINNHIQLQQYNGVLDMLALLLCSKEGLQCLEFKTDVLKQMMHYSIDTIDYGLSESVFNFEKDPNEEIDNDVVIIFNEENQVIRKKGATLQKWLCAFSNSSLKVIKSTETPPNLARIGGQDKLICNSKMAIFILTNETPSTELTHLMNAALEAQCDDHYFLKKIFPVVINDGVVPDIFKTFRSVKITHQPNTEEEQDKSEFLKTFSEVFLE